MRSTVEEERHRTADAMRGIYEDARNDTSAIFRQSTERFTEVIHGMKHMAAEMQRELEATRSELRRGILELPQETAESAAQMRRVIVDQIEALAELNRIVARHGRGLDAPEPARRTAAGNVRERDESRPASGLRRAGGDPAPCPAPRTSQREPDRQQQQHRAAPRRGAGAQSRPLAMAAPAAGSATCCSAPRVTTSRSSMRRARPCPGSQQGTSARRPTALNRWTRCRSISRA